MSDAVAKDAFIHLIEMGTIEHVVRSMCKAELFPYGKCGASMIAGDHFYCYPRMEEVVDCGARFTPDSVRDSDEADESKLIIWTEFI